MIFELYSLLLSILKILDALKSFVLCGMKNYEQVGIDA